MLTSSFTRLIDLPTPNYIHQQNVWQIPDGTLCDAVAHKGTRVAYHQFEYLHSEFGAFFFRCGMQWYATVYDNADGREGQDPSRVSNIEV